MSKSNNLGKKKFIFIDSNVYEGMKWYELKDFLTDISKQYRIVIPLVQIKELTAHVFKDLKEYTIPDLMKSFHDKLKDSPIFKDIEKESEKLYNEYCALQKKS